MIKYFISFAYSNLETGMHGFANMEIDSRAPIAGLDHIREITAKINKKRPELGDVIVMNWQRFEGGAT